MQARQRDPHEILHVLLRQAILWRDYGAPLPANAALAVLQQLPGLANYDPLAEWQAGLRGTGAELAEGIDPGGSEEEQERRRRALVLADWLRYRAGTDIAERVVIAAERIVITELEALSCPTS
jgi:hypothetical protein